MQVSVLTEVVEISVPVAVGVAVAIREDWRCCWILRKLVGELRLRQLDFLRVPAAGQPRQRRRSAHRETLASALDERGLSGSEREDSRWRRAATRGTHAPQSAAAVLPQ